MRCVFITKNWWPLLSFFVVSFALCEFVYQRSIIDGEQAKIKQRLVDNSSLYHSDLLLSFLFSFESQRSLVRSHQIPALGPCRVINPSFLPNKQTKFVVHIEHIFLAPLKRGPLNIRLKNFWICLFLLGFFFSSFRNVWTVISGRNSRITWFVASLSQIPILE